MIILLRLVIAAVLAIAVIGAVFMLGMRSGSPRVRKAVKHMNKKVWNPRALQDAGTEGSQYSVVRHVGRSSGTPRQTPIGAKKVDDAFVIMLPYGTDTDWLKNLRAADGGEVVHDGATYTVGTPEVVASADAGHLLSDSDRKAMKAFNVDELLRLPIVTA